MHPANNRLTKTADFIRVKKFGTRFSCPYFNLFLIKVPVKEHKFGYIVSNKIGNAVKRNRIKRRLREFFSAWLLEDLPGFNAIIIGKRESLLAQSETIVQYINKAKEYYRL